MNDVWLDEIWSIELVRELHSALGVFTQTHHDNNHYLNSLFIYFFGQRGNWPGYRIPAECFGIGTVVLAWFIGARRDRWTAFFSMLLVSFSYVLILYSSEARGYAALVFFCFASFLLLERFVEKPGWPLALLFSLNAIFGLTSHLTYFIFLCASFLWFLVHVLKGKWVASKIAAWILACYAVPILYLAALYVIDIRDLQIGGGTPNRVLDGYREMLAWACGGPNASAWQWLTATISVIGLVAGILLLIRERSDEWIFFISVIVLMPLAMPFFEHGTLHYVRYFIVAFGFLLLLFGRALGWIFETGRIGKVAALIICSAFIAINAWSIAVLFKFGRGHTAAAIRFVVQESRSPDQISFGGDQDFRTQFILDFYWREMMPDKPVSYYDHDHWPADGPEWVIFHEESFRQPVPPGKSFFDKFGNWYQLARSFPTAPLSGVHWFLYRKIPKPTAANEPLKSFVSAK